MGDGDDSPSPSRSPPCCCDRVSVSAECAAADCEQIQLRKHGQQHTMTARIACGHRPLRPFSTMWLVTCGILLLMCMGCCAVRSEQMFNLNSLSTELHHRQRTIRRRSVDNMTVCQSIDVRRSINASHELALCDVIEGHLKMILIGDVGKQVSFPRLKQVTHYIIFYRVQNLPSFSQMFPNLAVIRGHQLFLNYALVVYENQQLRDLGLIGLKRIMRGTVRIEKNPYLCYLNTIDWQLLTGRKDMVKDKDKDNMAIQDNGDDVQCAGRVCMDTCGNSTGLGRTCWNQQDCQTSQSKHCHPFCEGGCTTRSIQPLPRDCVACKDVVLDGECMKNCPKGTFLYEGWRCISQDQCTKMTDGSKHFKAHEGVCVLECPGGFTPKLDSNRKEVGSCEKCERNCPKRCQGDKMLSSIWELEKMKGCTYINGSLRIQVHGENIVRSLEENLKDITEISGYLRVSYSEPLVSMNFLRNLQVIGGESLEAGFYSLYFLQNVNLQSLWPNTTNFRVRRGRAFFHFNHRLCLDKINSLLSRLEISTEDNVDVGQMSNGDKAACKRYVMNAEVITTYSKQVLLSWDNFRHNVTDFRTLLGYNVYYRESPHQNMSIFSGRDACGGDSWKVMDFPNQDLGLATKTPNGSIILQKPLEPVREVLTGLKPFTQYAFYVETMTALMMANATTGRSEIKYFTTAPDTPSIPRNLVVEQLKPVPAPVSGLGAGRRVQPRHESLYVTWDPPARPNGIITEYVVRATHNPEQVPPHGSTDASFCKIDGFPAELGAVVTTPKPTTTPAPKPRCCACPSEGGPREPGSSSIDHDKSFDQINFENELQNAVFTRKRSKRKKSQSVPVGRRRRSIDGAPLANNITNTGPCVTPHRSPYGEWCEKYVIRLPANDTKNSTTLHELRHFAEYTIEVQACQAAGPGRGEPLCSPFAIDSKKTRKSPTADAIQQRPSISNNTASGFVTLNWLDPPDPNGGRVRSYVIYIQRMDDERAREPTMLRKCPLDPCKSPPCERKHELQLAPGNNSLRVRAYTLAGLGPPSQPVFWLVQAPDGSLTPQTIVGIVVGVLFILLFVVPAGAILYKRIAKQPIDAIYTSWNPYYGGQISYQPDDWEVDIEKVYFDRVIGKGSFGSVYDGTALLRSLRDGPDDTEQLYRVAIKTLLEDASMNDRQAFLAEASLMKEFNCYHVVRLMGIVSNMNTKSTENIPRPPFVIMELMAKGDLKSYLRSMRPEDDGVTVPEHCPVLPHIYQMAIQIADGMAYLTQMNSVHRDLAARNCMVADDMTIKIGDFGMTRHLYEKNYYKKGGKGLLPVRWMGPESLRDGRFTSQSDVWSFGVVLWEMCTYAAQPYQGLSNEEVINHVLTRNRMSRPENCPERLYHLMYRCWEYRPSDRPTFIKLVEELLPDIGDEFAKHSFYHTQWPAMVAEAEAAAHEEPEPTALTPLTAGAPAEPPPLPRRPHIAESEDLSDEDECDMELRTIGARQPRVPADPEANYAEFEAMKLEGRNGGHGSVSSAENSKAHSLQFSSSDGSKGSKTSNGSARNGYIAGGGLGHMRTAEC